MNTHLTHLPQNKQDDLQKIVAIVREHCGDIGMIILFGSYARGGWKEAQDLEPDRKSGHVSDYDILVLTESDADCDSRAKQDIEKACINAGLSATPRFIYHEVDFVNRKLEKGQYFFTDVVDEGKMLYDSGNFTLAKPKSLSPQERLEITSRNFKHRFQRAEQFLDVYNHTLSKGWMELSAFNLHQTAEACYKTMLLVFTAYIPDEHYLALLGRMVEEFDPSFIDIFPSADEFQRDAFTALEYAYIGARYDDRYSIDEPTLTYLAERVEALLRLTEERCNEKLTALQKAADDQ
jgi:HEPN domain-containing protein/predicted nucleotidyltransferase